MDETSFAHHLRNTEFKRKYTVGAKLPRDDTNDLLEEVSPRRIRPRSQSPEEAAKLLLVDVPLERDTEFMRGIREELELM